MSAPEVDGVWDRPGRRTAWSMALLAVLAAVYFAWPVWRALFPLEIDVDEPWNAYNAGRLLAGLPLYPDAQSLIANNYPPLSFVVVAGLSWLGLDPNDAGRLLSLVAVIVTALSIGGCVRLLGGGWSAAALAGLWFLATAARFFDNYVGKNDPHLLALAVMVLALAWFLRSVGRGRAAEPAVLLMVVAGFTKHTLLATPAAALLWLIGRDRQAGLRAAAFGVAAAAAGLLACVAIFGGNFIAQLQFAREYSLLWALGGLGQLQWLAPALIICMVWWWYDRDSEAARFTRLYAGLAFVVHFAQKFGQGVGINAQFELLAATAIGLGLAFDRIMTIPLVRRWGLDRGRALVIGILIVRLLISTRLEPYLTLASPLYRAQFAEHTRVLEREVARVRAMPGAIVCNIATVCRLAGKPFLYDTFAQHQRLLTGKISAAEYNAQIVAHGLRNETIDERAGAQSLYARY